MQSSTAPEQLQAPKGAWRVPVLVILGVMVLAAAMYLLARVGGWIAVLLAPVALFGLALAINVIIRLIKGQKQG